MGRWFLVVTFALWALATPAGGQEFEQLSSLEREAADKALAKTGLQIEPAPQGKLIGHVHVVGQEVFQEGWLTWANIFHITTRNEVIARRVLLAPGDLWSEEKVDETLRAIRDPLFHSVVLLLPVKSREPGTVDILVVVRDLWSLRLNSNFQTSGNVLTLLQFSLAENNLFGRRKLASFGFLMDQGKYSIGPTYLDENVWGSRFQMTLAARMSFSREANEVEGTSSSFTFGYPLWNLDRRWAFAVSASHFDGVIRSFQEADLRTYDNPDTEEIEAVPWRYDLRTFTAGAAVTRAFPGFVHHRVSLGYSLDVQRPDNDDSLGVDAATQAAFVRDVFPNSERVSAPYVSYSLFQPRYMRVRNLRTFDLREDYRLGPDASTTLSVSSDFLGADRSFWGVSASVGWAESFGGDDYHRIGLGAGARLAGADFDGTQGATWQDKQVSASLYTVSPSLGGWLRVVGSLNVDSLFDETQNRFYTIGGSTGLRGYPIGQFMGESRYIAHIEARSRPWELMFLRWGGVAFWDAGHAADGLSNLELHHNVGVGLRVLIPQIEAEVGRIDWAFAADGPTAGFPGRLSLGFFQVF